MLISIVFCKERKKEELIMWFVYTFIMIVIYGLSDVLSTIYINAGDKTSSFKLRIGSLFVGFIFCLILFLFKFGESGFQLFNKIMEHPGILIPLTTVVMSNILFFIAVRYVGLSIGESIANTYSIFSFIGFILLNLIRGYFDGVKAILSPLKIILILFVIISICLLPNIENIGRKKNGSGEDNTIKINKKKMIIGIIILLLGSLCEAVESLVSAYYLEIEAIDPIDYTLVSYLFGMVIGLSFFVYFAIKEKKPFNPFKKGNRITIAVGLLIAVSSIFYYLGVNDDPIKSNLLIVLYPILPIVLARFILKEKFSWKTGICISCITVLTIVFVVISFVC